MKPLEFKEATIELKKPQSMDEKDCGSLFIHQADGACTSLWTAPFWKRVQFLIQGKMWLTVLSGSSQPPVKLEIKKNAVKEN